MNLTEVEHNAHQHILVYGDPKVGKTQLVGELAHKYNLLWFDLENGFTTLLKLPQEAKKNIELIRIPDTKHFPIAIETLLKVFTVNSPASICEEHGKVNCALCKKEGKPVSVVDINSMDTSNTVVVIDSLTQLGNSAMNHLVKNQPDTYKPEWTDYRDQGSLLEKLLSTWQQARYHIVAITHVGETLLNDKSTKLVPMCGTTNFSRNTSKYFDHVVYAQIKNKQHNAGSSTSYSLQAITGSRTDMELESGDTLVDIITGKVGSVNKSDSNMSALAKAKAKLGK